MKSPMVQSAGYIKPEEKGNYTEMQVLRSAAGWYIGTMYENRGADGKLLFQEPGSRDSDYFATKEVAAAYLKVLNAGSEEDAAAVLRATP